MVTKNKDGPIFFPTFVRIISIYERKPRQKKMETTMRLLHSTILAIIIWQLTLVPF